MKKYHSCSLFGNMLSMHYLARFDEKVRNLHTQTVYDRYLELQQIMPHIFQRCSSSYIASYLRISRETYSRMRSNN